MKPDLFEAPDYFQLDDLLTEEHKLVRDAARSWVKRDITPIIEDYAQRAEFPEQIIKGLAEIGAFGPYIPVEYGGAGCVRSPTAAGGRRPGPDQLWSYHAGN